MCSILCVDKKIDNFDEINHYLKYRGPDKTTLVKDTSNDFTFVHNLLSITGDFTPQPLVDGGIVFLFNGEIYNYKDFGDYKSDGECVIDLYKEHGVDFVKKLDGEFALILLDFINDKAVVATDPFKTKPLFCSISESEFGVSTYRTPLDLLKYKNVCKMKPNTCMVFKLSDYTKIDEFEIVKWDLNQYKTNFDDWNEAFNESIIKRTRNTDKKIFMGLSSGYDSGAIACELLKLDIPFKAYSVIKKNGHTENMEVLRSRHKLISNSQFASYENLYKDVKVREFHSKVIKDNSENFVWTVESSTSDYKERWNLCDDRGAAWISYICSYAQEEDEKIYLSGTGVDEIFSDYGFNGNKMAKHSNFGGLFPEDLETIFPWNSFYKSTQESYLAKEEYTSGIYGIETRYPFLDKKVVQEFLSLNVELKNNQYKSVLYNYFINNKFAFSKNQKIGF